MNMNIEGKKLRKSMPVLKQQIHLRVVCVEKWSLHPNINMNDPKYKIR